MNLRKLINIFEAAPQAANQAALNKAGSAIGAGYAKAAAAGAPAPAAKPPVAGAAKPPVAGAAKPAASPAARPGTAAAGVAFNQGVAPPTPPSAGNEALKGQVIGAGAPNTTTPAEPSGAAAAMASKSAAPTGADASTGGAAKPAAAAPSTQGSAAGFAPAAAPAPAPASSGGAAKPAGFSATGMVSTDFEESVEEDQDPAAERRSKPGLQSGGNPSAPATVKSVVSDLSPTNSFTAGIEAANQRIKSLADKPGDASAYVGGPVDATARVPDTSKAIPNTQSKMVNNPMQDFEESIEEELAEMLRLSGLPIMEKAASKQQQKFMGMVHAMQKGEKIKGASAELKKAAKGMSKKAAKDFASTKHKGLPKKVTEGVMLEAGSTLEHIVNKFKYETKKFINGEELDTDLYEALFDYYNDNGEMPYGVAKARTGDPYQWINNKFENELDMMGYTRTRDELNFRGDRDLTELALLAGLTNEDILDTIQTTIDKATLPKAFHGEYDRLRSQKAEREFQRSGSAYSDDAGVGYDRFGNPKDMVAIKSKDYLDPKPNRDRDLYAMATGSKSADAANKVNLPTMPRLKESELNECGDMDMDQQDSFNVSTNMSSDGTKSVNISAQGDRADELLQMLKMAGMRPHDDHDHSMMSEPEIVMIGNDDEMMDEERETEYSNTPEEEYQTVDSILRQGNDLNREKRQNPVAGFTGDNPLGESTLDADLDAMLESILIREREGTPSDIVKAEEPYKDPKTGKMVTPIKGATNPPPDSEFPPGDKRNMMPPTPRKK